MNNKVLTDGTVIYYALAVNNRVVTGKYTDQFTAEQQRTTLPKDMQSLAEVVPVDSAGRQLLLG